MTERAYTVAEIDELRRAVRLRDFGGAYSGRTGSGGNSGPDEAEVARSQMIEDRVRTYMLAGLLADDIANA